MKINKHTAEIISDIERLIAWETYNPNSYNGYTGEEGKEFRYPVFYKPTNEECDGYSTKSRIPLSAIDEKSIHTIKYRFGSNHLFIGNGIVSALEYLEKRYSLDFAELENPDPEELPFSTEDLHLAISDMQKLTEMLSERIPADKTPTTKTAEWALQKVLKMYYENPKEGE